MTICDDVTIPYGVHYMIVTIVIHRHYRHHRHGDGRSLTGTAETERELPSVVGGAH